MRVQKPASVMKAFQGEMVFESSLMAPQIFTKLTLPCNYYSSQKIEHYPVSRHSLQAPIPPTHKSNHYLEH